MPATNSALRNRLTAKLRVRHLTALATLAELGHVGRSADALGLTQPAVTLLLADMEELLEAPLFVRHARGVTPTALTLDLLPLVRQMLARLDDSSAVVAAHREHGNRLVRAAATAAAVNGMLTDVLPGFGRDHPQIEILIIPKYMTTAEHLERYVSRVNAGEYCHGTKAIERSGKEASPSCANVAVGQGLRRSGIGRGRGSANRVHVETATG